MHGYFDGRQSRDGAKCAGGTAMALGAQPDCLKQRMIVLGTEPASDLTKIRTFENG